MAPSWRNPVLWVDEHRHRCKWEFPKQLLVDVASEGKKIGSAPTYAFQSFGNLELWCSVHLAFCHPRLPREAIPAERLGWRECHPAGSHWKTHRRFTVTKSDQKRNCVGVGTLELSRPRERIWKEQNWSWEAQVLLSPLGGPRDCLIRFPPAIVWLLHFPSLEHFPAPSLCKSGTYRSFKHHTIDTSFSVSHLGWAELLGHSCLNAAVKALCRYGSHLKFIDSK